jgi:hypothetical protein
MNGAGNMNVDSHHHHHQQLQQHQQQPVQSRLAASGSSSSSSIELLNARQRPPAAAPTNIVHVTTSDGEWFPVKKKLLRPCIALTKVCLLTGGYWQYSDSSRSVAQCQLSTRSDRQSTQWYRNNSVSVFLPCLPASPPLPSATLNLSGSHLRTLILMHFHISI